MKRQLLQTFLIACFGYGCIVTLSSGSSGITGNTSCGGSGCHSNLIGNPAWGIGGLPYPNYVPGETYNLTVGFNNSLPGAKAAGFDLTVYDGGSIISARPGTAVNGTNELCSTTPKMFTSGSASWTFTWVAPTASSGTPPLVEFQIKCCAVNSNGIAYTNDISYQDAVHCSAQSTSVSQQSASMSLAVASNPVHDAITISGMVSEPLRAYAIALNGIRLPLLLRATTGHADYTADISTLPAGNYHLIEPV